MHVHRGAAPGRRGRRDGPGGEGHRRVPRAARRPGRRCVDDGPAAAARSRCSTARGYVAELQAEHTIEAEGRLENLAELVGVGREVETVDEFLEQVGLVADTDELDDDDDSSVVLMTLHAAKGLEFPSCSSSAWRTASSPTSARSASPTSSRRSAGSPTSASPGPGSGCTSPTRGAARSSASTQYNPPSRFLDEIPAQLVEHVEGRRAATAQPSRSTSGTARGGWTVAGVERSRDEIVERAHARRAGAADAERGRAARAAGRRRRRATPSGARA